MDELGVRVLARVGAVEATLVGEDNQRVGFNKVGHQGGEGVVVAHLDLVGGDRVVLVDDRNDLEFQ